MNWDQTLRDYVGGELRKLFPHLPNRGQGKNIVWGTNRSFSDSLKWSASNPRKTMNMNNPNYKSGIVVPREALSEQAANAQTMLPLKVKTDDDETLDRFAQGVMQGVSCFMNRSGTAGNAPSEEEQEAPALTAGGMASGGLAASTGNTGDARPAALLHAPSDSMQVEELQENLTSEQLAAAKASSAAACGEPVAGSIDEWPVGMRPALKPATLASGKAAAPGVGERTHVAGPTCDELASAEQESLPHSNPLNTTPRQSSPFVTP